MEKESFEALVKELEENELSPKYCLAQGIGELAYEGDKKALKLLIKLLKDKEPNIQCAAIEWLKEIRDAQAIGPLKELVGTTKNKWLQQKADKLLKKLEQSL